MSNISVVAVDLDGTLLKTGGEPAPEGMRLLNLAARRGVHVILATTRQPRSVQVLCRRLGLNAPVICTNGAYILGSPIGPVWAYHTIPYEAASGITRLADEQDWELCTTVGEVTYFRRRPGQPLGPLSAHREIVAANAEAIVGEPTRILAHQPAAIVGIREYCQTHLADQCRLDTFYRPDGQVHSLCVVAAKANKGDALTLVLEKLGLGWEEVLAIGDNFNDLPMLRLARVGIVMANGPDAVKEAATEIAPSNDEEGVAWALRKFVL